MADEKLQEMLGAVQVQNQQLQNVMMQKQALSMQKMEIDKALEEVERADSDLYKSVGPVLIKSTKAKISEELEELKEQMSMKIKSLDRQEEKLQDMMKESQTRLQNMINPHGAQAG